MDIISIDGVSLPAPHALSISMADLDSPDTSRNEEGVLQRDRVREGVYKIELMFKAIEGHQVQIIESAIIPAKLNVTFPDTTGMITKEMYVGDRTKDVVLYKGGVFDEIRWDLKFNLIEY